jgi:hypothetical protein
LTGQLISAQDGNVKRLEIGMNLAVSAMCQEIYMSHGLVSVTIVTNYVQLTLNAMVAIVKTTIYILSPGSRQHGTGTHQHERLGVDR